VKRRQFITLFGGTAVAWPLAARAQQVRPLPRIGYLSVGFGGVGADAFREGLRDFGYVEGQNVLVEYRRAGEQGQLDALAPNWSHAKSKSSFAVDHRRRARRCSKRGPSRLSRSAATRLLLDLSQASPIPVAM
jgi:hypothetical protein